MSTYSALYLLKRAIEEVGSLDAEKIVAKLEGITYKDPEGTKTLRKEDHQVVKDVVWGRTAKSNHYPFRILSDMVVVPGKQIMRPPEETGCKM
jgi:ABC-type branched-subunit amino acid transport system substrate-binding protein